MNKENATPYGTSLNESCKESAKVWQQMGQVAKLKLLKGKMLNNASAHAVCGDAETVDCCISTATDLSLQAQDLTNLDGYCWYITAGKNHEPSIADDFEDALSPKLFYSLEIGTPATTHRVTVERAERLEDAACKRHKVKSIMWA